MISENETISISTQATLKNTETEESPTIQEIALVTLASKNTRLTSNGLPTQQFVIEKEATTSSDIEVVTQKFESTTFSPIIHKTTSTLKVSKKSENRNAFSIKKAVTDLPTKISATSTLKVIGKTTLPDGGLEANLQKKASSLESKMTENMKSVRENRNEDVTFLKEISEGDNYQIPVRVIGYDERPQASHTSIYRLSTETEPDNYELEVEEVRESA